MKYLTYVLGLASLIIIISCSNYSEITFPYAHLVTLAPQDSAIINLNYNSSINLNDSVSVTFKDVAADSRCPIGAMCIWAGDAEITITLMNRVGKKDFSLHSFLFPRAVLFDGYSIELTSVKPLRKINDSVTKLNYKIGLKIKHSPKEEIKPIWIISASDSWLINKDPLNISNLSVNNNLLTMNVNFSGGCKNHSIDLFVHREMMESNPLTLLMEVSHSSNNDMCKALITKEIKFDLNALKEFLIINYNYSGKIQIIVRQPDGGTAGQPPIEYGL